ncbi:MAG: hypothetical protein ACOCRO_00605 [Halanaerobiales bacterium]
MDEIGYHKIVEKEVINYFISKPSRVEIPEKGWLTSILDEYDKSDL